MEQAIAYAESLDVPFAFSSNGDAFLEHDRPDGLFLNLRVKEFEGERAWSRS